MQGLKVRDIMSAPVTTLKRNDKLTLADDMMRLGRIRHLPVLDDDGDKLTGIVSQRDLFRGALAQALGYGQYGHRKLLDSFAVKDVMGTEVLTTTPDTLVMEAAKVLMEHKIGCLPVLENDRPCWNYHGRRLCGPGCTKQSVTWRRARMMN